MIEPTDFTKARKRTNLGHGSLATELMLALLDHNGALATGGAALVAAVTANACMHTAYSVRSRSTSSYNTPNQQKPTTRTTKSWPRCRGAWMADRALDSPHWCAQMGSRIRHRWTHPARPRTRAHRTCRHPRIRTAQTQCPHLQRSLPVPTHPQQRRPAPWPARRTHGCSPSGRERGSGTRKRRMHSASTPNLRHQIACDFLDQRNQSSDQLVWSVPQGDGALC